jgi:hypothetical protein
MNIIERGRAHLQSLIALAKRTVWDWKWCPGWGSTWTICWGTYGRNHRQVAQRAVGPGARAPVGLLPGLAAGDARVVLAGLPPPTEPRPQPSLRPALGAGGAGLGYQLTRFANARRNRVQRVERQTGIANEVYFRTIGSHTSQAPGQPSDSVFRKATMASSSPLFRPRLPSSVWLTLAATSGAGQPAPDTSRVL